MAPKTQEASAIKHQEIQKPVQDQSNFQMKMQAEIRQHLTQTTKSSETYKQKKYDAKKKGNGSYGGSARGQKKQKENEGERQEQRKKLSGTTFDITI